MLSQHSHLKFLQNGNLHLYLHFKMKTVQTLWLSVPNISPPMLRFCFLWKKLLYFTIIASMAAMTFMSVVVFWIQTVALKEKKKKKDVYLFWPLSGKMQHPEPRSQRRETACRETTKPMHAQSLFTSAGKTDPTSWSDWRKQRAHTFYYMVHWFLP